MLPAPTYWLVLLLVTTMGALVVVLFALLLVQRGVASLINAHVRRREAALSPLLLRALEAPEALPALRRALGPFDRLVLRRMLLQLALDLRGDESRAIADLYRTLGLLDAELQALGAWRARRRAAAAANLATLRMPRIQRQLVRALDDPDRTVRIALIRAIGEVGDRPALVALIRRLGDRSLTVVRQVEQVLIERGREVVPEIVAYAESTRRLRGRRAAVEVLGLLRTPLAADLLLGLVRHPDRELRVRAVKAAAAIGDPRFLPAFHELVTDGELAGSLPGRQGARRARQPRLGLTPPGSARGRPLVGALLRGGGPRRAGPGRARDPPGRPGRPRADGAGHGPVPGGAGAGAPGAPMSAEQG